MTGTIHSRGRFRRPSFLISLAALLLGLTAIAAWRGPAVARGGDDPPGAYQADSPEPNAAETLILECINRCRASPAEDAVRCAETPGVPHKVDLNMFKQEMAEAKAAPPLVFDLALLKAARWHSYYQILNGMTHDEEEGKQGFTGRDLSARVKLAGFNQAHVGENIMRNGKTPWFSHAAFVIDWGAGPGGMQPERGHRRNILNPAYRAVGVGAVPWSGSEDFAVTHDFGAANQRMLGGVVFNDRKHSRFYEMGEGVGDVPISTGTAQTKSWKSGAYAVGLPRTGAQLCVELEGAKYVCPLPDGEENVKFDVVVSDLPLFKQAGKLLAALKKIPKVNKAGRFAALVDLHLATKDTMVEEGALAEIAKLSEQVHTDVDSDMAAARKWSPATKRTSPPGRFKPSSRSIPAPRPRPGSPRP